MYDIFQFEGNLEVSDTLVTKVDVRNGAKVLGWGKYCQHWRSTFFSSISVDFKIITNLFSPEQYYLRIILINKVFLSSLQWVLQLYTLVFEKRTNLCSLLKRSMFTVVHQVAVHVCLGSFEYLFPICFVTHIFFFPFFLLRIFGTDKGYRKLKAVKSSEDEIDAKQMQFGIYHHLETRASL